MDEGKNGADGVGSSDEVQEKSPAADEADDDVEDEGVDVEAEEDDEDHSADDAADAGDRWQEHSLGELDASRFGVGHEEEHPTSNHVVDEEVDWQRENEKLFFE